VIEATRARDRLAAREAMKRHLAHSAGYYGVAADVLD
jgi:DNA-binding GntR family transcriptional regulator